MSNRPPISFRLTDDEYSLLTQEQLENESINQTAARLLRQKLGIQNVDNKFTFDKTTIENLIYSIVEEQLENIIKLKSDLLYEYKKLVSTEIDKLSTKINEVEGKLPKSRTTTKKVIKPTQVESEK